MFTSGLPVDAILPEIIRNLTDHSSLLLSAEPGAGKSTIGVLLAKSMGYNFLDTDLIIQSQQKNHTFLSKPYEVYRFPY